MLKNTDGQKSASFTMMIIAFAAVTLWLIASIVQKIGHFEIRPFSGTEAMAYLGPILALYWGRRGQQLEVAKAAGTEVAKADSTDTAEEDKA